MSNYPLNRSDFTLVQGITQTINFFVRNIDRQYTQLPTGASLSINLVDLDSQTLLLTRALTIIDPTQSLYALVLTPADTLQMPIGDLTYSVSVNYLDGTQSLLWTDLSYNPGSYCKLVSGPIPGPIPPVVLDPSTFVIQDGWATSSPLPGSSFPGSTQTWTLVMNGFSGPIYIQGSLITQPSSDIGSWFQVVTENYTTVQNGNVVINTTGNYIWLRIQVPVSDILRNPGSLQPVFTGTVSQILYKR